MWYNDIIKENYCQKRKSPAPSGNPKGEKYSFKLEPFQTVKSFKIRGAMSKMTTLTEEERQRGVATISSGNHGAVALAAVIDKPERVGGSNIAMMVSGIQR